MKPLSQKFLADFVSMVTRGFNPYESKNKFRVGSLRILCEIARRMELPVTDYDIHFNAGGQAVSGDAILHSDSLYVNMSVFGTIGFYYRHCEGRKDYTGGRNMWIKWEELLNLDAVAKKFQAVVGPKFLIVN